MQKERKQVKSMSCHGFSQFELTSKLVTNLYKYDISPTAKLVLLYLSSCYNPKKAHMFPKQKTMASKLGVSERSIVRAVQELVNKHLIVIECKYTNYYKFTSQIVSKPPLNENNHQDENMSGSIRQNDTLNGDNLSPHGIEPTRQLENEPASVDDFKILKDYAEKHNAKNVTAYINYLKRNGSADKIIADFKAKEASDRFFAKQIEETKAYIAQIKRDVLTAASEPPKEWKELKSKLLAL